MYVCMYVCMYAFGDLCATSRLSSSRLFLETSRQKMLPADGKRDQRNTHTNATNPPSSLSFSLSLSYFLASTADATIVETAVERDMR